MIVFDLSALADDSHRRHFIKRSFCIGDAWGDCTCGKCWSWKCDYAAYYAACDQDKPIMPVINVLEKLSQSQHVEIWSDRCDSSRSKTEQWIRKHIQPFYKFDAIKMRPIGDVRPQIKTCSAEYLMAIWIDEISSMDGEIEMAFSADPAVIALFRRRGIFTFDCNQGDK